MLMNVFVSLSQPSFLLANETNHVLLFSLLDAMNAILEHQYKGISGRIICCPLRSLLTSATENQRFVDVIIKGHKRFEALRDFTVDGADAELDRLTMERKDAGESLGARSTSQESARSPVSTRSASLDDVPEDSTFSIGDDEDEDATPMGDSISRPDSVVNGNFEDALPIQSRSMSENARGKQPMGLGNFSRSTSRNTSNTSLPSLVRLQTRNTSQSFVPDYQWVC